jgi:hypothetical protein
MSLWWIKLANSGERSWASVRAPIGRSARVARCRIRDYIEAMPLDSDEDDQDDDGGDDEM